MPRRAVFYAWLLLPFTLSGGCCGLFAGPTLQQAKAWAAKEIPVGSTNADVKQFAARHGFEVHPLPASAPSATAELELTRTTDTCDSLYVTFIQINIDFNAEGRVRSVVVRQGQFWQ